VIEASKRLGNELARWRRAGYPLRPAELERTILKTHCRPCEDFRGGNVDGYCKICTCSVRRERASLNKIAVATTECALPEPKWTEYEGTPEFHQTAEMERQTQAKGGCG
jgi:hypothetical protein